MLVVPLQAKIPEKPLSGPKGAQGRVGGCTVTQYLVKNFDILRPNLRGMC